MFDRMSGNRLESLKSTLAEVTTGALESDDPAAALVVVQEAIDRLEALATRLVDRIEERHLRPGGHTSVTSLLEAEGVRRGKASRLVRRARAVSEMPVVCSMYSDGQLNTDQVEELIRMREIVPDQFREGEEMLARIARNTRRIDTLRRALAYWLQAVAEPEALAQARELQERRRIYCSRSFDGRYRLEGWLDPEGAETLLRALDGEPPSKDDRRTTAQRRADHLIDMARHHLACRSPRAARPSVEVHVSLDALLGNQVDLSETDRGEVLVAETVRRLCCDAVVGRVVFGPEGIPVEVGARTRTVPAWLRRAVVARDRGCRFPDAADRQSGAMPTTFDIGPRAGRPAWTTSSSSAAVTTPWSTREDGGWSTKTPVSGSNRPVG
ncbi:MAG: HNH endonuclease [Acidimicrobiia bacterium]|nr:MAG: HNH endonuclease [Acidimicrobiia bacterium]